VKADGPRSFLKLATLYVATRIRLAYCERKALPERIMRQSDELRSRMSMSPTPEGMFHRSKV